jgi:Xaa-Pro dipeptidase
MSLGASGTSFDTIVSFGKNAALPHHSPDKTRLRKGELILIDAGAKDSNYCSDITRTFAFGKIGEGQKEMIDVVKEAQRMAIGAIRQGRDGREIHSLAENYLNETRGGKYKGRFIHALGHSVGLEVHDGPGFSKQKNILKPGMVITVEPGVYVPGFGGVRFEDDVLITEKGSEVL